MAGLADYIRASNGDGEAVRAIVTAYRGIANTDLITDSVLNWPAKFVATSGSLDTSTGLLDPDTITVFKGHLTGSIITIEEFAPGYADIGNTIGQVVILKPNTLWADILAEALSAGGASVTIGATPPADPVEGDLWGDTNGSDYLTEIAKSVGNILYPIGSYYINETNSTNPGTLLGFGTWVAVQNRTIVGKGTGTFATAGATGGSETHTLTNAEMPVHSITWSHHGDEGGSVVRSISGTGLTASGTWIGNYRPPGVVTGGAGSYQNPGASWGSGAAHNNLQPYIVAYIWKRTA